MFLYLIFFKWVQFCLSMHFNKIICCQLFIDNYKQLQWFFIFWFLIICVSDILPKPSCHQIYNLFYSSDPSAVRLEPLLHEPFKFINPIKLPRYSKFPFGDGLPIHTGEHCANLSGKYSFKDILKCWVFRWNLSAIGDGLRSVSGVYS